MLTKNDRNKVQCSVNSSLILDLLQKTKENKTAPTIYSNLKFLAYM